MGFFTVYQDECSPEMWAAIVGEGVVAVVYYHDAEREIVLAKRYIMGA